MDFQKSPVDDLCAVTYCAQGTGVFRPSDQPPPPPLSRLLIPFGTVDIFPAPTRLPDADGPRSLRACPEGKGASSRVLLLEGGSKPQGGRNPRAPGEGGEGLLAPGALGYCRVDSVGRRVGGESQTEA